MNISVHGKNKHWLRIELKFQSVSNTQICCTGYKYKKECDNFCTMTSEQFAVINCRIILLNYDIFKMISSDFTVRVHPVVILSIVDAYERRDSKVTVNNRGVGSLLGYYEKNAVEIVNCYAVKYQAIRDECLFDKNMNKEMFDMNQLANPYESIVGWYLVQYTTSNEIHDSDQTLHDFYMSLVQKKTVGRDNIPVIHLVVDMANTEPHLGIYAYKVKIPQTEDYQSLMLIPVQLQVVASEAERVACTCFLGNY
ncbi:putative eukaryotic translation initiation factor 3 subunit F [Trichinella spiralis]|uniref:putative eukaryotic translation initiation factor 3 subunit F n=1 Tax=Trichinella spiralis TaxID=6334 RepID=UPI0001EFC996|nr:putative eukaryotic translation initiation factor 3 subunit F [Trichinella spiralis]